MQYLTILDRVITALDCMCKYADVKRDFLDGQFNNTW